MASLIVFEGVDGTGKSTQHRKLYEWLTKNDFYCEHTKEPTNITPYGKKLRDAEFTKRLSLEEELDLFYRDRVEHTRKIVEWVPTNDFILQDRSYWSTMAYQSPRGADIEAIRQKHEAIALVPDVLFIFDAPLSVSLERIGKRGEASVFEDTLNRVKDVYDSITHPNLVRIDATQSIDKIFNIVRAHTLRAYPYIIRNGSKRRWQRHIQKTPKIQK